MRWVNGSFAAPHSGRNTTNSVAKRSTAKNLEKGIDIERMLERMQNMQKESNMLLCISKI